MGSFVSPSIIAGTNCLVSRSNQVGKRFNFAMIQSQEYPLHLHVDIALYVLSRHCPGIAKKGGGRQIHHCAKMGVRVREGGVKSILEILKF